MNCKWCTVPTQAVGLIPMDDKSPRSSIPLCASHIKSAINDCWYVEDLAGNPLEKEYEFMKRITARHIRLRGTAQLKYAPAVADVRLVW